MECLSHRPTTRSTAQAFFTSYDFLKLLNCIAIDSKFQGAIAFQLLRICCQKFLAVGSSLRGFVEGAVL